MEGHRQIDFGDAGPERIELRQVVVQVFVVGCAPDRLAGQGEATEPQRRHALNLGDCAVDVRRGDAAHRRQPVVVVAEGLPRPVVPHMAHVLAERGVRRRPDGEALVGEEHLGVHAVGLQIGQAFLRRLASAVAQAVFALELDAANPHRAKPLGLLEPPPLRIHGDARQPLAEALVHARAPQIGRLLHMAVRGHHEVLVGIVGTRRAPPPFHARRLEPPGIVRIRRGNGLGHPLPPSLRLASGCSLALGARGRGRMGRNAASQRLAYRRHCDQGCRPTARRCYSASQRTARGAQWRTVNRRIHPFSGRGFTRSRSKH